MIELSVETVGKRWDS